MGKDIAELLEILNKSFQAEKRTVAGLCKSVEHIIEGLKELRSHGKFSVLYKECQSKIIELELRQILLPRKKTIPKKLSNGTDSHVFESPVRATID